MLNFRSRFQIARSLDLIPGMSWTAQCGVTCQCRKSVNAWMTTPLKNVKMTGSKILEI